MKKKKVLCTMFLLLTAFFMLQMNVNSASYSCLSNGTYKIVSALSADLVMDITGKKNGSQLVVWNKNGGENQDFILYNTGAGWYRITNRGSNKVIDLAPSGNVKKGSKLVLNDYTGKDSQLWRFYSAGNGYYIQNKSSYYLDVYGGVAKAGSSIQAFPKLNQTNQIWKLVSSDNGYSKITGKQFYFQSALNSSLVMDITGYRGEGTAYSNGNSIVLWKNNNGRNQRFNIEMSRDNWYKITNESTGKVVTVKGGKGIKSETVALYSFDGSDAQMWRFYNAGNGYYYVKNKLGYYLDVYNGQGKAGQNIITFPLNKQNNQKWKLISTSINNSNENDSVTGTYAKYTGIDYSKQTTDSKRLAVLKKAQQMCTIQWKCPASFLTWASSKGTYNTVEATDKTKNTMFVKGKTYVGIPYSMIDHSYDDTKWINYVEKGLTTSTMQGTYLKYPQKGTAKGMDCSYFVYLCMKAGGANVTYQNTTAMLSSKYYKKISMSLIKPGDILLKKGHVMLYAGKSGSKYAVFEATSAGSKTRYYEYSSNELNSYSAYKYVGW